MDRPTSVGNMSNEIMRNGGKFNTHLDNEKKLVSKWQEF
jgi:hypothetical protein